MPGKEEMYRAFINRDSTYEGIFFVGVKTTGIFCRPTCSSKKPKKENIEYFSTSTDAIRKGYRPCKICKPMEKPNETPLYVKEILSLLYADPTVKISDDELQRRGIGPTKIRRWFLKNHKITFRKFQRLYRINSAFNKLREGSSVIAAAYDSGFESLSGFSDSFKSVYGVSPSESMNKKIIYIKRVETPIGVMFAAANDKGICMFEFSDRKSLEKEMKSISKTFGADIIRGENKHINLLEKELALYFDGKLKEFTVPLSLSGTDFQKAVWNELRRIPYAKTLTYAGQAAAIGKPEAVRAVANANGRNKISIVIPCHRVIGSNGELTGYGGGLWRKKFLLDLEQKYK